MNDSMPRRQFLVKKSYFSVNGYVYAKGYGSYNLSNGSGNLGYEVGAELSTKIKSWLLDAEGTFSYILLSGDTAPGDAPKGANLEVKASKELNKHFTGSTSSKFAEGDTGETLLFKGAFKGKHDFGQGKLQGEGNVNIALETRTLHGKTEVFLKIKGEVKEKSELKVKWGVFDVKVALKGKLDVEFNLTEAKKTINATSQ